MEVAKSCTCLVDGLSHMIPLFTMLPTGKLTVCELERSTTLNRSITINQLFRLGQTGSWLQVRYVCKRLPGWVPIVSNSYGRWCRISLAHPQYLFISHGMTWGINTDPEKSLTINEFRPKISRFMSCHGFMSIGAIIVLRSKHWQKWNEISWTAIWRSGVFGKLGLKLGFQHWISNGYD